MTMTPSQALRAPRVPEGPGGRAAAASEETRWPIMRAARAPGASASDPDSWVRIGQRIAVGLIGVIIALGTRPVEALGGIDGDPEDDRPTGDRLDPSAAAAA